MTQVYRVTSTNSDRNMTQCPFQYLSLHSLSMVVSMNSIKCLFVVWAFLVLGVIARCKPMVSNEPCFSTRTLAFASEGSDCTDGSKVDALDTKPSRIAGAAARIAGADGEFRLCRGQRVQLSRVHRSTDWFDFLARSTRETARPCSLALGTLWSMAGGRSQLFVSLGDTTRSVVQRKAIFGLKHREAKWKGSEKWQDKARHL